MSIALVIQDLSNEIKVQECSVTDILMNPMKMACLDKTVDDEVFWLPSQVNQEELNRAIKQVHEHMIEGVSRQYQIDQLGIACNEFEAKARELVELHKPEKMILYSVDLECDIEMGILFF